MDRLELPALFHALAGLVAVVTSFATRSDLSVSREVARPAGLLIFCLGTAGFTWALVCLQQAFLGNVEPVTDRLVTNGPYRWVRHPLYLSMAIMALGLAVALRSLWGLLIVLGLFLPLAICRARHEERALHLKFDRQWADYATRTHFLVPLLW